MVIFHLYNGLDGGAYETVLLYFQEDENATVFHSISASV